LIDATETTLLVEFAQTVGKVNTTGGGGGGGEHMALIEVLPVIEALATSVTVMVCCPARWQ